MDKITQFDDLFGDDSEQQDESGDLLFTEVDEQEAEREVAEDTPDGKWKILIVDDEEDIHSVTRIALKGFTFRGKPIEFYDAYSAKEAEEVLKEHPDIALILLDVVMETSNAGLDLVKVIREKLGNKITQIIIRTGQPGQAPEREVIVSYDINDYKTKTELTSFKLFTVALASLRTYDSMQQIGRMNEEFRREIDRRIRREKVLISAKENAERSEQVKSEFLQHMSEQLQEPLDVILKSSDQILNEIKDQVNINIKQMLDEMNHSGREIIRAVQMISDLSDIQCGKYEVQSADVDMKLVIQEIIDQHKLLTERNKVEIQLNNHSDLPSISGDPYAIQQIFYNVIDNSVKNTLNGSVEISISRKDNGRSEVVVKDTGKGISADFQKDMFKPFTRENKNKPGDYGLGLGLTLSKEFCNLINAEFEIKSETGKGTVVSIKVPDK